MCVNIERCAKMSPAKFLGLIRAIKGLLSPRLMLKKKLFSHSSVDIIFFFLKKTSQKPRQKVKTHNTVGNHLNFSKKS